MHWCKNFNSQTQNDYPSQIFEKNLVKNIKCDDNQIRNPCATYEDEKKCIKLYENALEVACILIRILVACGISPHKADKVAYIIVFYFLNFDELPPRKPNHKSRKRIRKNDLYEDLRRECGMNRDHAKLTMSVIKCAFKAFHHRQDNVMRFNSCDFRKEDWCDAANHAIVALENSGASPTIVEHAQNQIEFAFEEFKRQLEQKQNRESQYNRVCNCCNEILDDDQILPRQRNPPFNETRTKNYFCKTFFEENFLDEKNLLKSKLNCEICPETGILNCKDSNEHIVISVRDNEIYYDPDAIMKQLKNHDNSSKTENISRSKICNRHDVSQIYSSLSISKDKVSDKLKNETSVHHDVTNIDLNNDDVIKAEKENLKEKSHESLSEVKNVIHSSENIEKTDDHDVHLNDKNNGNNNVVIDAEEQQENLKATSMLNENENNTIRSTGGQDNEIKENNLLKLESNVFNFNMSIHSIVGKPILLKLNVTGLIKDKEMFNQIQHINVITEDENLVFVRNNKDISDDDIFFIPPKDLAPHNL